jgi:hypothetical protein
MIAKALSNSRTLHALALTVHAEWADAFVGDLVEVYVSQQRRGRFRAFVRLSWELLHFLAAALVVYLFPSVHPGPTLRIALLAFVCLFPMAFSVLVHNQAAKGVETRTRRSHYAIEMEPQVTVRPASLRVMPGPALPGSSLPLWVEATWRDEDGTVFGWYHHEPTPSCRANALVAPQIGALVSHDGGQTFTDLGPVITTQYREDCDSRNGFFAGGHGDFAVIVDESKSFFYFVFSGHGTDPQTSGIAMARMAYADRLEPGGRVWKFYNGLWDQPGLHGKTTPLWSPALQPCEGEAWAAPSIYWNSYLREYVVLAHHSCSRAGPVPSAGVYISFLRDVANPALATAPQKLLDTQERRARIAGEDPNRQLRQVGKTARLVLNGRSVWELEFSRRQTYGRNVIRHVIRNTGPTVA